MVDLLTKIKTIKVNVYTDCYDNPWGPNGQDDKYEYDGSRLGFDNTPRYQNITIDEFIKKEYINLKPGSTQCYGFLDVNHDDVNQWIEELESGSTSFEICNYDTINCYKLELVN